MTEDQKLKYRLRTDLNNAMRARDEVRKSTLRIFRIDVNDHDFGTLILYLAHYSIGRSERKTQMGVYDASQIGTFQSILEKIEVLRQPIWQR